jgi:hypothetical protein
MVVLQPGISRADWLAQGITSNAADTLLLFGREHVDAGRNGRPSARSNVVRRSAVPASVTIVDKKGGFQFKPVLLYPDRFENSRQPKHP